MNNSLYSILFFVLLFSVIGCAKIDLDEDNFFVFGHLYSECGGEGCIETYKLTETELYEDIGDDYTGNNPNFVLLANDKFEQVKDIVDYVPRRLLCTEDGTIFGCPDCADQGALQVWFSEDGQVKKWRIDQDKDEVPTYLHELIDKINEKIYIINH